MGNFDRVRPPPERPPVHILGIRPINRGQEARPGPPGPAGNGHLHALQKSFRPPPKTADFGAFGGSQLGTCSVFGYPPHEKEARN